MRDAPDPNGASWGADGTILFAQRDGVIKRVSEEGGPAEAVIEAKERKGVYGPQMLPGGEWVLFTITSYDAGQRNWDNAKIAVQSLKTDVQKVLIDGSDARYVPTTGHIVYLQGNDLYAVAFDIENIKVTGDRFHAVNAIMRATANVTAAAHYGFSDTGSLVYVLGDKGSVFAGLTAVWVDLKGNEEPLNLEPKYDLRLKISPDGKKVGFSEMAETSAISSIQIWDIDDGTSQIIVNDDNWNDSPVWTPDSEGIVFRSSRDNGEGIYLKAASGAGNAKFIGSMPKAVVRPYCMSEYYPDTLFVVSMFSGPSDIAILPMEGESQCVLLPMEMGSDPSISPDGKWLAYTDYERAPLIEY